MDDPSFDVTYRLDPEIDATSDKPAACKGLRRQDRPFQPCLTLSDFGVVAALGLPISREPLVSDAVRAIVANLAELDHVDGTQWVFYARDNQHYVGLGRSVPRFYRRPVMIEAVELLHGAGLIHHQQTRPSPRAWYRSRIQPTEILRARMRELPAAACNFLPTELIVVRGSDGRPIEYPSTASTRHMRADVEAHNAHLKRFTISIDHQEARYDEQGYLVIEGCRLNPNRTFYRRIFNGSSTRGGRWYGPWWQSVPSGIRQGIRIGGEPTCEPDIRGCHMRLLCARANIELGDGDPYAGLDLPRGEVKLAINVMLNASSWPSARGALIERLSGQYGPTTGGHVDELRSVVKRRFPALEPFWNSGQGLVLQNIDANICARVQRRLRDRGIPCLSIHDSFVVLHSAKDITVTAMEDEFDRACRQLRGG